MLVSIVTVDLYPFARGDIPALLGSMGIANTMATFAFANFLSCVAAAKHRRTASLAVVLSWVSMILVAANYELDVRLFGASGLFVQMGLITWLAAFGVLSILIFRLSATGVGGGWLFARSERKLSFLKTYNDPNFGIPCMNDVIATATASLISVYYPLLFVYDIDCPGFFIGMQFAKAGIDAGDALIYITFSRPWNIVLEQLKEFAAYNQNSHKNVYILDCYSRAYMPDQRRGAHNVFFADPRNPVEVYHSYARALTSARRVAKTCRAIYEPLSDFISVADPELVTHYLRRTVVFEELKCIKSLYIFSTGTMPSALNQEQLKFFFTSLIKLTRNTEDTKFGKYVLTVERIFDNPVIVTLNDSLEVNVASLFIRNETRIREFAERIWKLRYQPAKFNFLPFYPSYRRILVMVQGFRRRRFGIARTPGWRRLRSRQ